MSDPELVPSWVPEIAPGVRADVYPVEPPRTSRVPFCDSPQELVLDRQAVTSGYGECRRPYEFSSCLPTAVTTVVVPPLSSAVPGAASPPFNPASGNGLSPADLSKLRTGIAILRRSRPTKLQRVEEHTFALPPRPPGATNGIAENSASAGSKKAFPLQKPSGSSTLEDWFNKLSSGATFNASELSRSVPLGPAIVRATGKVIEMMATRSVPTQRAAWYIRIAVLNECIKQVRPDRPRPSAKAFWTRQLCGLLKTEVDAIRARKTAVLGSMDRVAFWDYVLDLARWQADEDLLDIKQWLLRIASILRVELLSSQSFSSPGTKIAVSAARRFLPEFLASKTSSRTLLDSLLPGAGAIVKAWKGVPVTVGKGDSAGGSSQAQAKRDQKPAPRKGLLKRPHFTPNLCHREVTLLLSAAMRVLDDSIIGNPESETRMSDLERFVLRGLGIIIKNRNREGTEAGKIGEKPSLNRGPGFAFGGVSEKEIFPHCVIRELEMLPGHGDVSKPTAILREAFEKRGGLRGAVKEVCSWAVDGPVSDKAEAVCVGCALIVSLAHDFEAAVTGRHSDQGQSREFNQDIHKPRTEARDPAWTPPLQREVWNFLKSFSRDRKLSSLDKDDRLVRFIVQLCRVEQLSLRVLARDISRLSSHGHPGTGYLIKCLALLPDPVDQQVLQSNSSFVQGLDCRRPLLRKFGYVPSARLKHGKINEQVLEAVFSGDMARMERETNDLISSGDTNNILSTAELVRVRSSGKWLESSGNIGNKIYTMTSFLLLVGEPGMAVEWLLGNLGDIVDGRGHWSADVSRRKRQNELLVIMFSMMEDCSRYIAASGLLEDAFHILKRAWLSPWLTGDSQRRVLLSCASFAKLFSGNPEEGSPYWSKMVGRNLQNKNEGSSPAKMHMLALACVRGQVEQNPSEKPSMNDPKADSGGVQGDNFLLVMTIDRLHDTDLVQVRASFSDSESQFPLDTYLAKGFTVSDVFGTVFIPVLTTALSESIEVTGESRFSSLVVWTLQLMRSRQNDIRFQGVRPLILVEFISLIIAGCLSGRTDAAVSLEVLVGMGWIWKILAPGTGVALATTLRDRVDYHCNNIRSIDPEVLSALLFNMVTRFSGDPSSDEPMVAGALGKEPFGVIDMQVALLAAHRRECGADEEFGTRIGEAAVSLICVDSARALASSVLRSCTNEEWKHVVVGLVGYSAAMAMSESLGFVIRGLTVEAPKNNALHQERAAQWYQADSARRGVLECVVESISEEVGAQVDTAMFDQLVIAKSLLTQARERGCMPSSVLEDGCRISNALESRLHCVLRTQRTLQNAETWSKRTSEVAELLLCAVPLLKKSAITAGSQVLVLCIKNLVECERRGEEGSTSSQKAIDYVLDAVEDDKLKEQLAKLLKRILLWVEEADGKLLAGLVEDGSAYSLQRGNAIRAFTATGTDVDKWLLLEGYGRGLDEEAAVSPVAFGKQGTGRELENFAPVVQLKRTYSTFSSLAV